MDSYEATKVVFSRIQALDPENASKIMGFIFIQDPCEKEMIRLACGPESILISLINQAKTHLAISSSTSNASSSPRIIVPGISSSTSSTSPRIVIPNNNGSYDFAPLQVPDQLDSMDPIISPSGRSDSMIFPSNGSSSMHRRSFSVNDVYGGEEGGVGFGWRPCMYYARGFCKNGGNCKFLHGGGHFGDLPDSPNGSMDGFDEMLKLKAFQQQQQRLTQIMAGGASFPYNKGIGFMNDSPRSAAAAAALMMGEEFHKFGRCRSERSDFSAMGLIGPDSSARQIYLTFPADSTFKEEDVSNYFSKFGPVQDVRIPYQQKRMFGFVTFVYPETVKMILAKGNPHFVCDSRVLVKPYKEKGKIPEKRQHHHQFDRADFAACLSPTGLDAQDSYDLPIGPRMLLNNQEMLRRKLEQAELQQALELQGRRLMNMQLMDLKNHPHHHPHHPFHPPGISMSPPLHSHFHNNHNFSLMPENSNLEISEDGSNLVAGSSTAAADEQHGELPELNDFCGNNNADSNGNSEDFFNLKNDDLHESMEHILPDNLFASPTKPAGENGTIFSSALSEANGNATASSSATTTSPSPLNTSSQQSCFFHMPRFSSGEEAVEM